MVLDSYHKQQIMELSAEPRSEKGTEACKKLRRQGRLPVNVYGHKEANLQLTISTEVFTKFLHQGHRIMHLNFSGEQETGMIKEVQYDALGDHIIHVDFNRISLEENVHMQVPVTTVGVAKGMSGGGILEHVHKELDIQGPALEIPEEIELHIAPLAIGDAVRVKDLTLPGACKFLHADPEEIILTIHPPKAAKDKTEETDEEGTEAAEPEVVGKKSDDEKGDKGE